MFSFIPKAIKFGINAGKAIMRGTDALNQSTTESPVVEDAFDKQQYYNDLLSAEAEKNREFQQSSAREAMQFEAEQAQINRDFQLQMSNTAYQRAMEDMKNAGLNPMLAYTQGGASVSSGAMANGIASSGSKADVDSSVYEGIASSAMASSSKIASSAISTLGRVLEGVLKFIS